MNNLNIDNPLIQKWLKGYETVDWRFSVRDQNLLVLSKAGHNYQLVRAFELNGTIQVSVDFYGTDMEELVITLMRVTA